MNASERLKRNKEKIMQLWLDRIRASIPAARDKAHPILIDTLPAYLDDLIEALSPGYERKTAGENTTLSRAHGNERARLTGYSLGQIIREAQILRLTVLEVLGDEEPLSPRERNTIIESVDDNIREASIGYMLAHAAVREQFVYTLTHDLRGPLTAAKASAQMLLKYPEKVDKSASLSRILKAIDRVDDMITDLLDANRVRAGERLPIHPVECNLNELTVSVIEEQTAVFDRIRLEASQIIKGYWDGKNLRRAIENLVSNAGKYSYPGTPITVSLNVVYGRATISVHNEGDAIKADDQLTLFDQYRRTPTAQVGMQRGWGLGLALVRGIAEAHGGSVFVDSQPDRGTTFTIDIPMDVRDLVK